MSKLRVDKIAAPIVQDEFTGSVYFDGTGDYLSVADSSDFAFGTEDFTIEFWRYRSSVSDTESYVTKYNNTNAEQSFWFGALSSGREDFAWYSGSSGYSIVSANNVAQVDEWGHLAAVRLNGVITLYLNGVSIGSDSSSDAAASFNDDSNPLRIGGDNYSDSTYDYHGYISNLRVCKGHAVYQGNFTPPTRELVVHRKPPKGVVQAAADNVTTLLACQSATDATLDSSGRHTITAAGNAHAQSANPGLLRRTLNLTTVTENTGSVFFDGTGDYLATEVSNDFALGTNDFTFEMWVYYESRSTGDTPAVLDSTTTTYAPLIGYIENDASTNGHAVVYISANGSSWGIASNKTFGLITAKQWYHLAISRSGSNFYLFKDGILTDSFTSSSAIHQGANQIGFGRIQSNTYFDGYISNARLCIGHAVYTKQFTPPTRELEVHGGPDDDRTVFLGLYDGENIFADKSGRHIIAAYGDRLSSPTPTATDSPIGITTVTPGLTRNVDPTAGPTFQGGAGFTSQNWLTLPKGTTTDRNRTGGRAIQGSGFNFTPSQTQINSIFYYQISSTGNALDFGDLLSAAGQIGSLGSSTRGIFAGQSNPAAGDVIQFVTIATTGNAVNFGNMTDTKWASSGAANSTRGLFAGGRQPSYRKTIDYITIAALGDAKDFGDLTATGHEMSAASSPTRAIFAGGSAPGGSISDLIDYVTIATTGNALDFGDLTSTRKVSAGVASQTRMCVGGGLNPGLDQGIEYLTISTLGNAKDFGNLTGSEGRWGLGGTSNSIRGVFGGGYDPSPVSALNTMDYITIASTGNANDFGDIGTSSGVAFATGLSDSHGGIS